MPFQAVLIETTSGPGTSRRILQTDLDKYESTFTTVEALPENIVSTIDDLSAAGELDEVRIGSETLSNSNSFTGVQ